MAQREVFKYVEQYAAAPLNGLHTCVFAYGPTGSGKTFTMTGERGNEGVIYHSLLHVFGEASKRASTMRYKFHVRGSLLFASKHQD